MTHDEMRETVDAYVLGTCAKAERDAIEAHLETCAECRHEVESLRVVVQALAFTAPSLAPPPHLRARVLETAMQGSDRRANAGSPSPARTWALLCAALLVLAVGLGAYAWSLRSQVTLLQASLLEADEAVVRVEGQLADLQQGASRTQLALAVLAAPDSLARIDLQPEATAPGARARAFWSRSRGMVFTASGLPPAPEGRVYQLWVLTSGSPISGGLLPLDGGGGVEVVVQTPLDLPAPVGMAVTVEPAGGTIQPTGERILLGLVG